MASVDDTSDLLIFKRRDVQLQPNQPPQAKSPSKTVQQPAQPASQPQLLEIPQHAPSKAKIRDVASAQTRDVKGVSCINHPWRPAYAYCAKDGLPYCFVDLISHGGKNYCLNDIDSVLRSEGEETTPKPKNSFTLLSSALLFSSALIILYFTQKATELMAYLAMKQGAISFLLNLNPLYIFPVANIAVILLALFGAITILRNSLGFFAFAFAATLGALFIMIYQYSISSADYALISSVIMLLSVSTIVYSRMSSLTSSTVKYISTPEIQWPKPEAF